MFAPPQVFRFPLKNYSRWIVLLFISNCLLFSSCVRRQKSDLFHYYQSFDELKGWVATPSTLSSEIIPHSGAFCIYTDEKNAYSSTFQIKFKDIDNKMPKKMKASVWCYTTSNLANAKLCLQIKNKDGEYKLWTELESKKVVSQAMKWTRLEITAEITKAIYFPDNEIALFVWNTAKDKVFLDDFALEVYQ